MKKIVALLKKHREILLYMFFGAGTTVVSFFSFDLFYSTFGVNELIANFFSWIFAVLFAFFTNKAWVFSSKAKGKEAAKELLIFTSGRLLTLGVEELWLLCFVTWLSFPAMLMKGFAQIIIVVSNYIISKLFVFKSK